MAFDDAQHVILFHDEVLLAVERDLLARVRAEQDPVARFDVEGDPLAVVVRLPVAGGDDRALLRLLFGGVRDDDAADGLFAFLKAVDLMRSCSGLTFMLYSPSWRERWSASGSAA